MDTQALYNENELLTDLRKGCVNAFTKLYRHYSVSLYYNVLSFVKDEHIAEELVQEVFTKVWRYHEYISIEKKFSAYLYVMARNQVFDFFAQVTKDQALYSKLKAVASEEYEHIEQVLFASQNASLIQKAIATLPPQRRRAFELCKMEGLTYRQASEEMGVSLSTLKDHMIYALDSVRLYLSKNMELGCLMFFWIYCFRS